MLGRGSSILETNDYNNTMIEAAGRGHIEIIKLMLEKGATNYSSAMREAVSGGHTKIMELMLELMLELILERGTGDYNYDYDLALI